MQQQGTATSHAHCTVLTVHGMASSHSSAAAVQGRAALCVQRCNKGSDSKHVVAHASWPMAAAHTAAQQQCKGALPCLFCCARGRSSKGSNSLHQLVHGSAPCSSTAAVQGHVGFCVLECKKLQQQSMAAHVSWPMAAAHTAAWQLGMLLLPFGALSNTAKGAAAKSACPVGCYWCSER
eukprot:scaffold4901_cov21-Tisochrysis_lutea.AAC.3